MGTQDEPISIETCLDLIEYLGRAADPSSAVDQQQNTAGLAALLTDNQNVFNQMFKLNLHTSSLPQLSTQNVIALITVLFI